MSTFGKLKFDIICKRAQNNRDLTADERQRVQNESRDRELDRYVNKISVSRIGRN
jgi:hypothetical protein